MGRIDDFQSGPFLKFKMMSERVQLKTFAKSITLSIILMFERSLINRYSFF